jgi:hypothetical protein
VKTFATILLLAVMAQADEPTPKDKTPGKGFFGATVRVNIENNEVTGIELVNIIYMG